MGVDADVDGITTGIPVQVSAAALSRRASGKGSATATGPDTMTESAAEPQRSLIRRPVTETAAGAAVAAIADCG